MCEGWIITVRILATLGSLTVHNNLDQGIFNISVIFKNPLEIFQLLPVKICFLEVRTLFIYPALLIDRVYQLQPENWQEKLYI